MTTGGGENTDGGGGGEDDANLNSMDVENEERNCSQNIQINPIVIGIQGSNAALPATPTSFKQSWYTG